MTDTFVINANHLPRRVVWKKSD